MLNYLKAKREVLEAQKTEAPIVDEEIEKAVEDYRVKLYKEKEAKVNEQNKAIDAKLELLDEVISEVETALVDEAVGGEQSDIDY